MVKNTGIWRFEENPEKTKTGERSGEEDYHIIFVKYFINSVKKYGQNRWNLKNWEESQILQKTKKLKKEKKKRF